MKAFVPLRGTYASRFPRKSGHWSAEHPFSQEEMSSGAPDSALRLGTCCRYDHHFLHAKMGAKNTRTFMGRGAGGQDIIDQQDVGPVFL